MPANFLHGVETIEILRGPRPIRGVKTAVIGLVGTAALMDCAAADRTVNEPILVTSDRDAAKFFGRSRPGFTIPAALDAIFDQGQGPICLVVNTLDPATHRASVTAEARTFNADNRVTLTNPQVADVVVRQGGITYVEGVSYTVDYGGGVITRLPAGQIPAGAAVTVDYNWLNPALVLAADVIGSTSPGGVRSGLQALLDTYNLFGFFAKILVAPVYCTQNSVAVEMIALAGRLRAVALIDAPAGTSVAGAITGRGPGGAINFQTSSPRAVLCYPHLRRHDAATNSEVLEPYSQRLAGVMAARDMERGYWWSPSNTEIKGIIGVERKITAMINDPSSEANLLNEAGITTVFNSFGTGMRTWGNRSAAWPSVTHPRNFINITRTADVLHESIEFSMLQFLDFPITPALIDSIVESVNAFIRSLIARGGLIDGRCVYDPSKNPPTQIALGQLTFDIEFMPPTPAERITFESFINIELLKKLGGQ